MLSSYFYDFFSIANTSERLITEYNKIMKTLWTKNFTIITIGTIISAIGAAAMNLVLSFVVFDETQSTFLSGSFAALSMIPAVILPLISSVWLDRVPRKPVIVHLDFFAGCLYLSFGFLFQSIGFHYGAYLLFSLIISATSSIYQVAYQSLYPNLIPSGFAQKGYTISGMIYPTVTIIFSPLASLIYTKIGVVPIFYFYALLLWAASAFEHFIRVEETIKETKLDFKEFKGDLMDAIRYLRENKGIRSIYATMPFGQGYAEGSQPLLVAYFSNLSSAGMMMYSFFVFFEFIGRTIGGLFQYRHHFKPENRFRFCYFVYILYAIMDAILLWIGYPWMCLNRTICGFCGINSATLRESSVQNYIPDDKRAKLNALMNIAYVCSSLFFKLLFGLLGEWIPIPIILTGGALVEIVVYYLFLYRNKEEVKPIYNQIY